MVAIERTPLPSAIRRLFDWLVVGQVMAHNPAASVRGTQRSRISQWPN